MTKRLQADDFLKGAHAVLLFFTAVSIRRSFRFQPACQRDPRKRGRGSGGRIPAFRNKGKDPRLYNVNADAADAAVRIDGGGGGTPARCMCAVIRPPTRPLPGVNTTRYINILTSSVVPSAPTRQQTRVSVPAHACLFLTLGRRQLRRPSGGKHDAKRRLAPHNWNSLPHG